MDVVAEFPSVCAACGAPIREGDRIVATDSGWVHAGCELPDDAPRNPLCGDCWTYHAGECA